MKGSVQLKMVEFASDTLNIDPCLSPREADLNTTVRFDELERGLLKIGVEVLASRVEIWVPKPDICYPLNRSRKLNLLSYIEIFRPIRKFPRIHSR